MKSKRSTTKKTTKTPNPPKTSCSDPTSPKSICLWVTDGQVCNQKNDSPSALLSHIETKHAPHGLVCFWQDCPKKQHVYSETRNFRNHLTDHTGEKSYVCSVCHLKLSRSGMAKHRRNVHPIEEVIDPKNKSSPTPKTKCSWEKNGEKCSYDCQDPADLFKHIDSTHIDSTQICYWKGCRQLLKPIFANSLERKRSVLHDEKAFLNHVRSHTGYLPYKCQHCPKAFAMEYKLVEHLRSEHPEPLSKNDERHFFCRWKDGEDCGGFAGATAVELTNHIVSYHKPEVDNFACHWKKCSLPPGQIKSKKEFILHFRQEHNKEDKPYDCPECGANFPWKSRLDWHRIQVHKEAAPHNRCYWMGSFSMCTQVCLNPTELREHVEKVHTEDIEKLICRWDGCWMEFTQAQDLVKHLSRHTGEKIHDMECSICHEKFTRFGLEKHRRLDHKDHERVQSKKRAAQKNDVDSKDNEIHEQQAKRPKKKRPPATAPTNPPSDQHAIYKRTQQIGAIDGFMQTQQPTSPDAPQDANYTVDNIKPSYAEYSDYEDRESFQEEARDVRYPQYVEPEYMDVGNTPGPSDGAELYPQNGFGFGFERL
ncbi:unnamed protein product [Caenorhabditis brenneri]